MVNMSKKIISEGKTKAEAIEKGLKEINLSKEKVDIKVIEEKKKSFFSILDPHYVKVEITEKEESSYNNKEKENIEEELNEKELKEIELTIKKFIEDFLKNISKEIEYEIILNNQCININLKGKDSSKLIGYRGEALNSLQLILSNIVKNKTGLSIRIIIDIENYREKRKQTLEELAMKIEKTVNRTGKKIVLEPMPAYERKIIHTKLQDSELVKTYSIGQNDKRRIVIDKK